MSIVQSQESKNDGVLNVIQDTNFTLEERWYFYVEAIKSGYFNRVNGYYFIPMVLESDSFTLYDDAYVDKYQTYGYDVFFKDEDGEPIDEEGLTPELTVKYDKIKEEILKEGYSAWINDW